MINNKFNFRNQKVVKNQVVKKLVIIMFRIVKVRVIHHHQVTKIKIQVKTENIQDEWEV